MSLFSPSRTATDRATPRLGRADRWTEEPLGLVRLVVGTIALVWTLIAVLLAITGADPKALQLVGALWAIYGLTVGFLSGVLEPVIDGFFHLVSNAGLMRVGGGYSAIDTLVARGHLKAAAEAYAERARNKSERVDATLRRAALLAGPLGQPETAAIELDNLRVARRLGDREDFRVGLALVELRARPERLGPGYGGAAAADRSSSHRAWRSPASGGSRHSEGGAIRQ